MNIGGITIFGGNVEHQGLANISDKKRYFVFAVFRDKKIKDANASKEVLIEQEIEFSIQRIIKPIDIFNKKFEGDQSKCDELLNKDELKELSEDLKKLFKNYFNNEDNKDNLKQYVTDSVRDFYNGPTYITEAPVDELEDLITAIDTMLNNEKEEENPAETKENYRLRF